MSYLNGETPYEYGESQFSPLKNKTKTNINSYLIPVI